MADPRERYVEATRRLSVATSAGAGLISLLMAAALWGQWHLVAFVAVTQAVLIAFNVWMNVAYLPRRGAVEGEIVRTAVNISAALLSGHVTHWPIPAWLWLPYVALAFDHLGRRVAVGILIALCFVQDVAGLVDGVSWVYPLTFTAFAVFCFEMSRLRTATTRQMLVESDTQRDALAEAHEETKVAHEQLRHETIVRQRAEAELRLAQKLEAVGRLAAGVAHEINTPVQFIGDGVDFAEQGVADVLRLVTAYRSVDVDDRDALVTGIARARALESEMDVDFLAVEIPTALQRSREGLGRVAAIVRSMKEFSHPDDGQKSPIDVNEVVARALVMATHEYKLVADVVTDLSILPPVVCHEGELAQVVLNIVINAAQAIGEVVAGTERRGTITVATRMVADEMLLSIRDTGGGIPDEIRDRVFEPFFTTKEVGRGTGQGLALARGLVERHGGTLSFESTPGVGTTFFIRLPVSAAPRASMRPARGPVSELPAAPLRPATH